MVFLGGEARNATYDEGLRTGAEEPATFNPK
jgi:hypothetical protein